MQLGDLLAQSDARSGGSRFENGSSQSKHPGLANDRAADRHPLPLAAGELRRPALQQRVEAQQARDRVHLGPHLVPRDAPRPQPEGDVVEDR